MGIEQLPKVLCKRLGQERRDCVANMALLVGFISVEYERVVK